MGSDPQRKDVFVEIDWMNADPICTESRFLCTSVNVENKTPTPEAIAKVVQAFADAPVSNPGGKPGINLHVDYGPDAPKIDGKPWGVLARGNKIPFWKSIGTTNGPWQYDWTEYDAMRKQHSDPIRDSVFRYAIYGHSYPTGDPGLVESSGLAERPGSRLLVTSHDWKNEGWTIDGEAGTFMHELGHNLGLDHGGADGTNNKEGYYSLMNYDFQFLGVDAKGKMDYSTGSDDYKIPFSKLHNHKTKGDRFPALDSFNDWDNIVFTGNGRIGSLGASAPSSAEDEPTHSEKSNFADAVLPEGSGGISVVGPTLTAEGLEGQVLLADITNKSDVETEFQVALEDSSWLKKPLKATVPAGATQRVSIPIAVDAATDDAEPVKVTLSHGGQLVSTSIIDVNAVDLSDPATEATVRETMEELLEKPLPGLEADVIKVLDQTVAEAVGVDLSEAEAVPRAESDDESDKSDSSLPLPPWALGLIAVAVLALVAITVAVRRKKS